MCLREECVDQIGILRRESQQSRIPAAGPPGCVGDSRCSASLRRAMQNLSVVQDSVARARRKRTTVRSRGRGDEDAPAVSTETRGSPDSPDGQANAARAHSHSAGRPGLPSRHGGPAPQEKLAPRARAMQVIQASEKSFRSQKQLRGVARWRSTVRSPAFEYLSVPRLWMFGGINASG